MFERIGALAIYVTDLKKAKNFYSEILGFEVSADLNPNLSFLRSKSGHINIYMEGEKKQDLINSQTCRLSFFLQAEKSASETYACLKAPEPVGDETACFQFKDPDGNIIEVSGKA